MMYSSFVQRKVMEFITDITSEYKRIYEIGSRYPDVSLTMVQQAFSNALFNNRSDVNILDVRTAVVGCKHVYPDVIKKSIPIFDEMFKDQIEEMKSSDKTDELNMKIDELPSDWASYDIQRKQNELGSPTEATITIVADHRGRDIVEAGEKLEKKEVELLGKGLQKEALAPDTVMPESLQEMIDEYDENQEIKEKLEDEIY